MVSIIIPVYNGEKYLEKCIDSLVDQTYKDIEIIIVDDGSTDKTKDIIEHHCRRDTRIKEICISNSGASSARNIGVSSAKGKYILFVDSDDYIELDTVELLVNKIKKDKSDIVCMGHRKIYAEKTEDFIYSWSDKKIYTSEFAIKQILNLNIKGYICDKFFKRDIWNKYNLVFEKNRYCEDWPVITKYIGNIEKVSFIN